jgi:hypothetical protein
MSHTRNGARCVTEEPTKVYLGSYPVAHGVYLAAETLAAANDELDAERERRRRVAAEAAAGRAAIEREAERKSWWGWLRAHFRRGLGS